jgi:hypothetical protein
MPGVPALVVRQHRITMKIVLLLVYLALFTLSLAAYAGEDSPVPIYQHVSFYTGTNTWFVLRSQIEKSAGWDETGEPSLPVGKAVSLAKAWLVSKGGRTNAYVTNIEFCPAYRGAPSSSSSKFRHFWFYIIHFHEVAQFGSSATCVVLLDGSVVEPQSAVQKRRDFIGHYLD